MAEKEGVIKFSLEYTPSGSLPREELRELNAWRKVCHLCGLIGQDPIRYSGYGYGNISRRWQGAGGNRPFVISGSQTGHLAELTAEHYTLVLDCIPAENTVVARGPIRPSSESLTHAAVYAASQQLRAVIHAHAPDIWRNAAALGIPLTSPDVACGTPEMAHEIARLLVKSDHQALGILAMGGHEDGVVTFGSTVSEAGLTMVRYLALAFERV